MFQLKIRNAEQSKDFRTINLTREEWLRWREVLVESGVCKPEAFEGENRRLVISYYPGTLPELEEDDQIMDLL